MFNTNLLQHQPNCINNCCHYRLPTCTDSCASSNIDLVEESKTVVKISFDKVVGHLFNDSMSLVTHKTSP